MIIVSNQITHSVNSQIFDQSHLLDKRSLSPFNLIPVNLKTSSLPTISDRDWKATSSQILLPEKLDQKLNNAPVTTDEKRHVKMVVPFNQSNIIDDLGLPSELKVFVLRFNGLCELICNKILIEGLLGTDNKIDFYKDRITAETLKRPYIIKSHLLDVYSISHRLLALFLGIYPDNIFSCTDQWNLTKNKDGHSKVNQSLLKEGLLKIENGEILKLEIFRKEGLSFTGHSLLVKKISNNEYLFFDPNSGEHRGLLFEDLAEQIDSQLEIFDGTDIYFSRGADYLQRLRDGNILNTEPLQNSIWGQIRPFDTGFGFSQIACGQ